MLYICYTNLNIDRAVGVRKKIKAQCQAFSKDFDRVYYTIFAGQTIYLLLDGLIIDREFSLTKKMCNDIVLKWLRKYDIDKVYIRYEYSDIWFLEFLTELKNMNIRAVLEFPTIPYDKERVCKRPIEDKYYREQLWQYIDCCTTYSAYETVFNIPCIPLVNGVEIEKHPLKQYRKKDGRIILVAVASMTRWHGYERVLQGMQEYYSKGGKRNVIFRLVGDGGQLSYYQRLCDKYQLQDYVFFCGRQQGEALDRIYDDSDIAIGSLGMYKTGLKSAAPIKLREYCARGIPFIYGYDDTSFTDEDYFGYRISYDDSPVNIEEVIAFYERLYDGSDFIKDMRQFTIKYLTWDKILQPVVEYFNKERE